MSRSNKRGASWFCLFLSFLLALVVIYAITAAFAFLFS